MSESEDLRVHRKKRLLRLKELKRKKKMNMLSVIKTVLWIGLIGGTLWYNGLCFSSLAKFTVSGNLSDISSPSFQYEQSLSEITNMIDLLINPIFSGGGVNMTQAFENVFQNATAMQQLRDFFGGIEPTTMQEFWDALQNVSTPRAVLDIIFETLWSIELPSLFPGAWNSPHYFYVGYQGDIPVTNVLVFVDIIFREPIRIVENVETSLTKGGVLTLSLTVGALFQALIQASYSVLVNATYNAILAGGLYFWDYIGNYITPEYLNLKIKANLGLQATVGVIPTSMSADVDLSPIIQSYIDEVL